MITYFENVCCVNLYFVYVSVYCIIEIAYGVLDVFNYIFFFPKRNNFILYYAAGKRKQGTKLKKKNVLITNIVFRTYLYIKK